MHDAPAALCARWGRKNKHTGIHSGSTGTIRHPPRNGFTASFVLFPGTIGGVDPVSPKDPRLAARLGSARFHQDLDADHGAPEPHDFSVRDTAARLARRDRSRIASPCDRMRTRQRRVHHIPPRVRDDRDTPLAVGRDGRDLA